VPDDVITADSRKYLRGSFEISNVGIGGWGFRKQLLQLADTRVSFYVNYSKLFSVFKQRKCQRIVEKPAIRWHLADRNRVQVTLEFKRDP
jgi:hypothetical protein